MDHGAGLASCLDAETQPERQRHAKDQGVSPMKS